MTKQKLISALQSRIAKRRQAIKSGWECYHQHNPENYKLTSFKDFAIELGYEQKVDKQLLRQLIVDERELKELREIRNLMYCEY